MKKALFILMILLTVSITAQERERGKHKGEKMELFKDFSAEEIAQLKTKKLRLTLDLNSEQQKKINAFILKNEQVRKQRIEERKQKESVNKGDKPSKEERLKHMNMRLDEKIAAKAEMKNILNDEQFSKWEQINERRDMKKRRHKRQRAKRKR